MPAGGEIQERARAFLRRAEVRWDDVAGLFEAKRIVASAIALSLAQPPAGVQFMPVRRILFFGPPGTGKTLLAAAASRAIKRSDGRPAAFYAAKVSELLNEGFGTSAQILSALYSLAKSDPPAVVFLDEFESIAARRGSKMGDGGEERRILSTLLAELDGLADKGGEAPYVLTIGATNRPWDLDRAILSRFGKRVLVWLPDAGTRRRILEIHIAGHGYALDVDWREVLRITDRFSGRELELLSQEATTRMIDEMNPTLGELAISDPAKVTGLRIRTRPLRTEDLAAVAGEMEPQTSPEEEITYKEWTSYSLASP